MGAAVRAIRRPVPWPAYASSGGGAGGGGGFLTRVVAPYRFLRGLPRPLAARLRRPRPPRRRRRARPVRRRGSRQLPTRRPRLPSTADAPRYERSRGRPG
ncbi:hypothetical protein PR202_gb00882 [Eleusine coracana subsp. coracana]|uniref:Uncharacterized protein n=1 Tax=Eleusine coracana subsp. coracana TaxID=191504 RepID=A0AAV5DV53_ELECO|nr:hypothetical protein PR202_gb00882 [Eleusine coracana subsp. coracana]